MISIYPRHIRSTGEEERQRETSQEHILSLVYAIIDISVGQYSRSIPNYLFRCKTLIMHLNWNMSNFPLNWSVTAYSRHLTRVLFTYWFILIFAFIFVFLPFPIKSFLQSRATRHGVHRQSAANNENHQSEWWLSRKDFRAFGLSQSV